MWNKNKKFIYDIYFRSFPNICPNNVAPISHGEGQSNTLKNFSRNLSNRSPVDSGEQEAQFDFIGKSRRYVRVFLKIPVNVQGCPCILFTPESQ